MRLRRLDLLRREHRLNHRLASQFEHAPQPIDIIFVYKHNVRNKQHKQTNKPRQQQQCDAVARRDVRPPAVRVDDVAPLDLAHPTSVAHRWPACAACRAPVFCFVIRMCDVVVVVVVVV
jgi:hypothetical protein